MGSINDAKQCLDQCTSTLDPYSRIIDPKTINTNYKKRYYQLYGFKITITFHNQARMKQQIHGKSFPEKVVWIIVLVYSSKRLLTDIMNQGNPPRTIKWIKVVPVWIY